MKLILHLQIKALLNIKFSSELVKQLKIEFPEAILFEADSHSEPFLIQQGLQFLKEATKVVLILESEAGESPSKVAPLIEKVIRHTSLNAMVLINGENHVLKKMMSLYYVEVLEVESTESSIMLVRDYLSSN
ncbi:MAG: hypothetical protein COW03_18250 [Cytophagales bacterium CG12_big_fil_rev_8_21_14_0_65_40_12]|nr:MAG: hypothetical protein COW03_18250 [Cytophagales bacterium CG12_big_fil_rev_8_21_14_0_65_40_12]PIW05245.1 MAG: hypothetical protein COW40_05460 [Cytophagales bacterium CG17_big_fil_post_rev_8_21_14_2_50_40_13]